MMPPGGMVQKTTPKPQKDDARPMEVDPRLLSRKPPLSAMAIATFAKCSLGSNSAMSTQGRQIRLLCVSPSTDTPDINGRYPRFSSVSSRR